jgi:hypothetical protein
MARSYTICSILERWPARRGVAAVDLDDDDIIENSALNKMRSSVFASLVSTCSTARQHNPERGERSI